MTDLLYKEEFDEARDRLTKWWRGEEPLPALGTDAVPFRVLGFER